MNAKTRLLSALLTVISACTVGTRAVRAQNSNFSVGTASGTELAGCADDPGGVPGNCWGLNISCPNVTAFHPYDATVKVTTPVGPSIGTIVFIQGGGALTITIPALLMESR
jgi:hypothetical protein